MVETGQPVLGVGYSPAGDGAASVELRRFPETDALAGPVRRGPVRPDFHVVGVVTGGTGGHAVDFERAALLEGAVFWLRPGQVHEVADSARLRGVLVLFTGDVLDPRTTVGAFGADAARPTQWRADARDELLVTGIRHLELLHARSCPAHDMADALRLLLTPLVRAAPGPLPGAGETWQVFQRFAAAVEAGYPRYHHVRDYEQAVYTGVRTIDRAVRSVRGISAKRFLDQRIALEARRQLVTTAVPVATVAGKLGFSEATNFVKFYRRMTGRTPGAERVTGDRTPS